MTPFLPSERITADEAFNAASHLFGSVLAVVGFVFLVARGIVSGDPWKIGSFAVYGSMLVALYVFSTLFHFQRGPRKRIFRKLDHLAIYLLIAGTYTPFAVVTLRGPWGWSLLAVVWTLAAVGIVQELALARRRRAISIALYLTMGWLAVVVFFPMLHAVGPVAMAWLFAGGILYTVGVFFYVMGERRFPWGHGVFHVLVVGGSIAHFVVIARWLA
jgi:hemolysin III